MFTQMSENADDVPSQLSSMMEDLAQGGTDVRDKQIRDHWGRHPATKYLRRRCTYYIHVKLFSDRFFCFQRASAGSHYLPV